MLDAQSIPRTPTTEELNKLSNSIIRWLVDNDIKEIPDKDPDNGILYLPNKFLQRGGGDCEDWALFLAISMEAVKEIDVNPVLAFGSYGKDNYLHAIVYIPSKGIPIDPLYWWKHPMEIAEEFIPLGDDPFWTIREAIRNYRTKGTKKDWIYVRKRGWIK